jgi:hypothetical protein
LRAACAHLLDVLREQHVIAERPHAVGHIADELRRDDDYMARVQGLIEGTPAFRIVAALHISNSARLPSI